MSSSPIPPNIKALAVSFCLLFFGFFAGQNYVTSVLGSVGDASLGMIYASLCLCAVFTPWVFSRLRRLYDDDGNSNLFGHESRLAPERIGLAIGAGLYAPFFLACATPSVVLQLCGSALLGVGASLLWVAQGSVMTAVSQEADRERDTGVFWAGYMGGNACGNLVAFFIASRWDTSVLFVVLAGFCCLGAAAAWVLISPQVEQRLLAPVPSAEDNDGNNLEAVRGTGGLAADQDEEVTVRMCLQRLYSAVTAPAVLVLLPSLVFIGLENAFWAGEFTQLVPKESQIGLVLSSLGLAEMVAGLASGLLESCLGGRGLFAIGMVVFSAGLGLAVVLREGTAETPQLAGVPAVAFAAAACFGVGDCFVTVVTLAR